MIELSGLAERSFKRHFQQATGMPPLEYVHTVRLEEAKQMLEAGSQSIEAIANEVGNEDSGFFSRLFRRHVNLTPAQYRKRFGAIKKSLEQREAKYLLFRIEQLGCQRNGRDHQCRKLALRLSPENPSGSLA
ncbi:helix-turn-helix domain-containing protein [Janthinobacterium sp. 17J80-10]|uniref:helix-turn-helix domain-containing protein n=1 Tax=Janthinobacterium sp. 17J80-10 TaxID=2497863 RepID=UPI001005805C|nr:helix-turn-helix domain-containing protein [Janthinobacterium sp. 17J80-10]QAU35993.1 AraC family transcriptional regulator [Janthinobacterium sp. 17J80-10]